MLVAFLTLPWPTSPCGWMCPAARQRRTLHFRASNMMRIISSEGTWAHATVCRRCRRQARRVPGKFCMKCVEACFKNKKGNQHDARQSQSNPRACRKQEYDITGYKHGVSSPREDLANFMKYDNIKSMPKQAQSKSRRQHVTEAVLSGTSNKAVQHYQAQDHGSKPVANRKQK